MESKIRFRVSEALEDRACELAEADKGCFPGSPWGKEGFISSIKNSYDHCLIAADDRGELIAYSILRILDSAEILIIGVVEKMRRKGVAAALMEEMIGICAENGAREMFLEVRAGNEAALALYEKYGFSEITRRRDYYSNPREDAVIMRKRL